ncbi:glucose-methanol-choline oxidoreductase, partial [Ilyonectria robusta]|uniref:glucose-methanol-choline oxidoreductase n=1 Tax=Ilyonectria robusta TaxID=1079257 RepID=UPI001E8DCAC2
DFIRENSFGHYVTGTCVISLRGDRNAVPDSNFPVHGVSVDASAFPRFPGAIPILATYVLSEKAVEAILLVK